MDVHSYARPNEVRVRHLSLDANLDFQNHQIHAWVTLDLQRFDSRAPLWLDTYDLDIERVHGEDGEAREFQLGQRDPILGCPLRISLQPGERQVSIQYRSAKDAKALQWLSPAQTHDGKQPFLYTQGQAILTRSWIPLQDSPGVRITYAARIMAPEHLQVLMSAPRRESMGNGRFAFEMNQAIPPYLLALACGEIAMQELTPRCAVYAEPGLLAAAAAELSDMPKMLEVAEQAFGAYRWERYDVLFLPPSFPFGGMENPSLTFATPTILAGDKSLVSLIAHELAHSWSGNLVSNATWSDFWLNEGFTVYLEQRIMEMVYGPERAKMEILLGLKALVAEVRSMQPKDQVLHIDLAGRNPDDGMTSVPYDKGAAFLRRLEGIFGREKFDAYGPDRLHR